MNNISKAMVSQNLMWFNPITYHMAYIDMMRKSILSINKTIYPLIEDTYNKVEPTKNI